MAKRKLTSSEKFNLEREAMAKEKPRNPNHMVIVAVQVKQTTMKTP